MFVYPYRFTVAVIAFAVAVIVVDAAVSLPPGATYDVTCGMGCGGGMLKVASIMLALLGGLCIVGGIARWRGE